MNFLGGYDKIQKNKFSLNNIDTILKYLPL